MILIYSHKPQRSGKNISSNTNNPPQDPPPPHEEIPSSIEKQPEITVVEKIIPVPEKEIQQVPDIPIEDTTPPVPEVCPEEKLVLPKDTVTKESIPETKPKVTTEIKTEKQTKTEPKISWFRRFVSRIKKFFRR